MKVAAILAALTLSACVSATPQLGAGSDRDARYVLNDGTVIHCERPNWWTPFKNGVTSRINYGECKDAAEAQGLVRVNPR